MKHVIAIICPSLIVLIFRARELQPKMNQLLSSWWMVCNVCIEKQFYRTIYFFSSRMAIVTPGVRPPILIIIDTPPKDDDGWSAFDSILSMLKFDEGDLVAVKFERQLFSNGYFNELFIKLSNE